MRLEARGEVSGLLTVKVFLFPWRRPFLWEERGWDPRLFSAFRGHGEVGLRLTRRAAWLGRGLKFWRRLRGISRRLYRAVTCRHWELHLRVGGGEAATTAWLAGGGWLWQAAVRQNLAARVRLATVPHFSVWPSFTEDGLAFRLVCTLTVRFVHLLLAGAALVAAAWQTLRPPR